MVQMIASEAPFLQPKILRVVFRKIGNLQYISHLDLMRTMTRVIIRSRIPVAYSEGFNPIPRLSFAAPLSVGVESHVEIMDIRITHPVFLDAAMTSLNENLPPELRVSEVYMAETKPRDIAFASYEISIYREGADDALASCVERALSARPLTVLKKTKTGERDTDISPLIEDLSVKTGDGCVSVSVMLRVENASFLNPDYLVRAISETGGIFTGEKDKEYYTILRTGFYLNDGSRFR